MSASTVDALLTANARLGCHAVDKKIVGPAYHDVATRYAADPQAQIEVAARNLSGGSGKWGQIPVPPYPHLTDNELRELAAI